MRLGEGQPVLKWRYAPDWQKDCPPHSHCQEFFANHAVYRPSPIAAMVPASYVEAPRIQWKDVLPEDSIIAACFGEDGYWIDAVHNLRPGALVNAETFGDPCPKCPKELRLFLSVAQRYVRIEEGGVLPTCLPDIYPLSPHRIRI